MIYIVGFKFQFNTRPRPLNTGPNIQEQLALAKRNPGPQKSSNTFDSRFIVGDTYKIVRIKKIIEEDIPKVCYWFANENKPALPDIDIKFSDTNAGDNYVAAACGKLQQLNEERNSIMASLESDRDL